ncbi:hypothetical protein PU629_06775 [Pullulanibacillus sp. KACC 23026]|uniref:hypothetical protein n=1 Tax=Pullulanibacillus sp. KACC 23026 TaxID=3028315 RepID=UPI0023B092C9|nr:hypothetical protein [Pullulanibacillus sp. KACC 23026]WEG14067.1 hypothetical protein PU629_06775 [Pullulanibacillus sp. KACC 23026]
MLKKRIGLLIVFFLFLMNIASPASAESFPKRQELKTVHVVTAYPDQVVIHTTYNQHVISTDAFLETHNNYSLIKEANGELYIKRKAERESPLASIIAIMGMKGEEALEVETASYNPVERIKSFIQFEIDAFTT